MCVTENNYILLKGTQKSWKCFLVPWDYVTLIMLKVMKAPEEQVHNPDNGSGVLEFIMMQVFVVMANS